MSIRATTRIIGGAKKAAPRSWRRQPGRRPSRWCTAPVVVAVPEPVVEKAAKRVNPIKLRQMQERLAAVEAEIPKVENSLAETEQALGVYVSAEETQRLSDALGALRQQHASLNSEWEELSMQLEESL